MPGRSAHLTLVSVATALVITAGSGAPLVGPAQPAPPGPVLAAARALPGCDSVPAPVEPVTSLPWAQRRYAPDRLAPLATGAGVTVAVIDSGVDNTHAQLRGQVLAGNDFLDGGSGRRDCAGHGTAVASLIAATPRDGVEFRGLAPEAKILPVRVSEQQIIDGQQSGRAVSPAVFAQAIRWAVNNGADVINLSVVLYEDSPSVKAAIEYALEKDVVVVAAAGNLGDKGNPMPYPAAYPGVIGVGAINATGQRSTFSQSGPYVDLVAPGEAVLVAAPGRGHVEQSGTSYAAPFVAATAALLRDYRPDLSAAEIAARIIASTDPAPEGAGYGSGVLNPYRALTDTGVVGRPRPPEAVRPVEVDPAVVAEQARRASARERAMLVAGIAAGAAVLTVLAAIVVPRGMRRRWRAADVA